MVSRARGLQFRFETRVKVHPGTQLTDRQRGLSPLPHSWPTGVSSRVIEVVWVHGSLFRGNLELGVVLACKKGRERPGAPRALFLPGLCPGSALPPSQADSLALSCSLHQLLGAVTPRHSLQVPPLPGAAC